MKLSCGVTISNRLLPHLSISSTQKFKNAVLAIMKPPNKDTIYLLLITSKNKSGIRYKIRGNIEKTFGKFRNEGKTTIRFKEPPHDLCITADKIKLGNFMLFVKKVLNNEEHVPEIRQLNIPQVKSQKSSIKMEIKSKSEYPVLQGFPSDLQVLSIKHCQLKRVDNRILKLKNLTMLILDRNHLTDVPADLKKLPIKHLSLSHNNLGKNFHCWDFLAWPLSLSLEYLNLSGNEMKFFPATLSRFFKLKILKLSNISVTKIPFRICLLPNLQELDLSHNHLLGLPGTITKRCKKLDILDISENSGFFSHGQNKLDSVPETLNYFPSLFELSVRSIIHNKIPYNESTVPQHLVLILDSAKLCFCGKICAKDFGSIITGTKSNVLANTFISSCFLNLIPIVHQACCPQHFLEFRNNEIRLLNG